MQVEQIDRDAAENSSYTLEGCMCEQHLAEVAEQFARHRHQARENERLREVLTTIRDRKWNTVRQGCNAAYEAAYLARAALEETSHDQ